MDVGKIKHNVMKIPENCGVVLPNEASKKRSVLH